VVSRWEFTDASRALGGFANATIDLVVGVNQFTEVFQTIWFRVLFRLFLPLLAALALAAVGRCLYLQLRVRRVLKANAAQNAIISETAATSLDTLRPPPSSAVTRGTPLELEWELEAQQIQRQEEVAPTKPQKAPLNGEFLFWESTNNLVILVLVAESMASLNLVVYCVGGPLQSTGFFSWQASEILQVLSASFSTSAALISCICFVRWKAVTVSKLQATLFEIILFSLAIVLPPSLPLFGSGFNVLNLGNGKSFRLAVGIYAVAVVTSLTTFTFVSFRFVRKLKSNSFYLRTWKVLQREAVIRKFLRYSTIVIGANFVGVAASSLAATPREVWKPTVMAIGWAVVYVTICIQPLGQALGLNPYGMELAKAFDPDDGIRPKSSEVTRRASVSSTRHSCRSSRRGSLSSNASTTLTIPASTGGNGSRGRQSLSELLAPKTELALKKPARSSVHTHLENAYADPEDCVI